MYDPQLMRNLTVMFNEYVNRRNEMTNLDTHNRLRLDLVEHIWAIHSQS